MNTNSSEPKTLASKSKSRKSVWIGLSIIIVLIGGIILFSSKTNNEKENIITDSVDIIQGEETPSETELTSDEFELTPDNINTPLETSSDKAELAAAVKTIEITGKNFEFSQEEIRVNKGDTVRIVFSSTQGFHDWVIDEFKAATEQVQPGTTTEIEFVADQAGAFEYYCSIGEHRNLGMIGMLIVE